jgi:hypothetical protein
MIAQASTRVPVASRVGDGAPGVITRGFGAEHGRSVDPRTPRLAGGAPPFSAAQPAVPFGGVAVNRSSIAVNPSYGQNVGPAVVRPTTPVHQVPVDTDSVWYRRYRDRYKVYDNYGWGRRGPVFMDPGYSYNYINRVDHLHWNYVPPPIIVNAPEMAPMQEPMELPHQQQEGPAANDRDAERMEQLPAQREEQPRRHAGGLAPEKLHELMIEGVQLFYEGKYNEAAATFLRVTLADRHNIDATLAYAVARFATGDYQISALAVRRGIRRMPEVVNSGFDVRDRYGNPDDFEKHLSRLERFVVENPELEEGWTVLGFIRHFSGQRELAAETFEGLKTLPKADLEVVQIFLNAEFPDETAPTGTGEVSPMLPPVSDRPLPLDVRAEAQQLISVELVE